MQTYEKIIYDDRSKNIQTFGSRFYYYNSIMIVYMTILEGAGSFKEI